jgi:hypothetical protein
MRVFQVSPDGIAAAFEAHHAQEEAEHACSCGNCGTQPSDEGHGQEFDGLSLFGLLAALAEAEAPVSEEEEDDFDFDVDFEPDFDLGPSFGPALLSRGQQLDLLGHLILGLISLTGIFAQMIEDEAS